MPYIEFYDEDFPWRYSPNVPTNNKVNPWLALVVLKEEEFEDIKNVADQPLPAIDVKTFEGTFPPATQQWAWAHVQINKALGNAENVNQTNIDTILNNLENTLDSNPDLGYSRIVCPRKLEPKVGYHAFLIPTFETGRLAGLGLDPASSPSALQISWDSYEGKEATSRIPYYHRWYFATGTQGDFEYLVRLLKPQPVDSRVGRRDMDVQNPGSNIAGIDHPDLGSILRLEGALKIPEVNLDDDEKQIVESFENWDQPYPHPFQKDLATFINLSDDYQVIGPDDAHNEIAEDSSLNETLQDDEDPVITPPLYGKWHALIQRLLTERDGTDIAQNTNWIHELNLDPRWRVSAGFGTKVIQDNQESYMEKAWEQVGDVLEANQRIRQAQFATLINSRIYSKQLEPLQAKKLEKFIIMANPVSMRVLNQGFTVSHQFQTSLVSSSPTSMVMRKLTSPKSKITRRLDFTDQVRTDNLIARINNEEVTAAPPKTVPAGVSTIDEVVEEIVPTNIPNPIFDLLKNIPWVKYLPLALIIVVLILFLLGLFGFQIALALAATLVVAFFQLNRWEKQVKDIQSLKEEERTKESVEKFPKRPGFKIVKVGESVVANSGNEDSEEAKNFKTALGQTYELIGVSEELGREPKLATLNLPSIQSATFQAINPTVTLPRLTFNAVQIPLGLNLFCLKRLKKQWHIQSLMFRCTNH